MSDKECKGGSKKYGPGADRKSGGSFGSLEYSRTNTMVKAQISKRGTKDA